MNAGSEVKARKINFIQGLHEALDEAMAADENVIALGEDIGDEQGGGMPGQIVDGVRESHRSNLQMAMASGPTIQASMTPPRMVGLLRASGKTVARP